MVSCGIHEILTNQILSNPMEFYEDLIDVSHIQNFMVQRCLSLRGALQGPIWPYGGVLTRCWHYNKHELHQWRADQVCMSLVRYTEMWSCSARLGMMVPWCPMHTKGPPPPVAVLNMLRSLIFVLASGFMITLHGRVRSDLATQIHSYPLWSPAALDLWMLGWFEKRHGLRTNACI